MSSSHHVSRIHKWLLQSPPIEWVDLRLRDLVIGALSQGPVPQHIAMVMDGNRRYARQKRIEVAEGHNRGFEALAQMLEVCYRCGVKVLTVYAFSVENFKRSRYEVDALMGLMKSKLTQLSEHGELFERYGASVRVLGQRELVAPDVLEAIDRAVDLTKHNTDAILNICFPYASRNEIAIAVRDTVEDWSQPLRERERTFSQSHIESQIRSRNLSVGEEAMVKDSTGYSPAPSAISDTEDSTADSTLPVTPTDFNVPLTLKTSSLNYPDPESIDAATLTEHMFTAGNPPVDLFIRTSGVERLSDFLLWQVHEKADIKFVDCMWPDFDLWHFIPILVEWQWKRRKAAAEERVVRRSMRLPKKRD